MEILLEGKDKVAQRNVARFVKYLVCRLKMIEKEDVESNAKEEYTYTFTDTDGKEQSQTKQRPKAVSLQFIELLLSEL